MAIPEGPFLPIYVLAIHSLNVAVGEGWLRLDNQHRTQRCEGVVLIPMETDEAPERLQHILGDSCPNIILIAPGKDWESMENAQERIAVENKPASVSIELVDYTKLFDDAISSLRTYYITQHNTTNSLMEKLWPSDTRNESVDSLQYSHSLPGCFDVARLVAIGCIQLATLFATGTLSKTNDLPTKPEIMSHIVYTSGTTGKPKGCVSSLASLQHYIRAKNLAHFVDGDSRVLLASAITFDPCFSDVLATCAANATLCIAPREQLYSHGDISSSENDENGSYTGLTKLLRQMDVTHILCTPTLWATVEGDPPNNVPSLKVVALGGEPIPKAMFGKWARSKTILRKITTEDLPTNDEIIWNKEYPRLYATYGVTEACVYQTCGEVVREKYDEEEMENSKSMKPGQSVGLPLLGTKIHICRPLEDENWAALELMEQNVDSLEPTVGEVVLSGNQVDCMSSYRNLPELTHRVFVQCNDVKSGFGKDLHFYRTGDMGYIDPTTGSLHIMGRIKGDGMVKINGVRIELAEIENSTIDDQDGPESLVIDCMAGTTDASAGIDGHEHKNKQIIAYCLLSTTSIAQLGISPAQLKSGALVPPGHPLLSLLRARCERRVRKGCNPSFFVLIDRLPLSPTGKRNRLALPPLAECSVLKSPVDDDANESEILWNRGKLSTNLANVLCECLNLQPCQRKLVTLNANFFALGGDSLAATRVVRGLYALHHGILDSRNLGGVTGTLAGPFAAKNLLQSDTLGDYVKLLDSMLDSEPVSEVSGSSRSNTDGNKSKKDELSEISAHNKKEKSTDPLYESLILSITLGYTAIASSLLDMGVDPNSQPSQGRLGKVTDRKQQRAMFRSNPLHLACLRGNPHLVQKLLSKDCRANVPNAPGSFPIHLACSRLDEKVDSNEEDFNRLECVKLLLDSGGTPISIKDGNKQTILHSAARSGHCELLKYIMAQWKIASQTIGIKFKSHNNVPGRIYDWQDRWFRTPVHWAVLNGRTSSLQILLDGGCSAFPPKPKSGVSKRATSVIIESPLEMSVRLYGDADGIGKEIAFLLRNAKY
eukprot:CAMPEP_0183714800 /NCGR_PEP_ID=MMETSP0737-20130205/9230_1 /TAXON_ID=385413 /ORGANISM="Thalassiosira miniscula, Strain CCMP1093" /LENGTH=1053 /DNA_ID=CAMNT_0025943803 /DNA_START=272 /DNA_END=3433 /DNA_ORIENTATION=-